MKGRFSTWAAGLGIRGFGGGEVAKALNKVELL